jgi:hypothetical protein
VPGTGGRDVHVAGHELVRADLALAFQHDELLFALVAVRWQHAARAHAHEARMRAGSVVAVQLADFHERADLDPRTFTPAQRASALGSLLESTLQDATAQALALPDAELRGLQGAGQRLLHALRNVAVVGNPVFFDPGRATHVASSASRS